MPYISLNKASLAYGHVALLDHIDFQLDEGERVGLIGRNGGGKSSMLKVLAGAAALDDGIVWRAPGARVCYVSQAGEAVSFPAGGARCCSSTRGAQAAIHIRSKPRTLPASVAWLPQSPWSPPRTEWRSNTS